MAWQKIILSGDPATELTGTAYRMLLVDSAGDVIELVHGAASKVLTSGGASADPTWEDAAGGAHGLDAGQTDVVITTPADDEVLAYDGIGDWINQTAAEAGLMTDPLTADCVGADEIDAAATDIAFAQIILTPADGGTGTTEGTLMYDSVLKHGYIYVGA